LIEFKNDLPPRTFAVGASLGIGYNYTFNDKFPVGILGNFQIDTNGDTISGWFLNFGYRF
jgi:hypothetical protein